MKEYDTWSFRDRSFLMGLAVSLAWHFFWFFSITIVISPPKAKEKPRPRVVSLGPVLNDTIFKTLIETRPELSQTFYRGPAALSPEALEPKVQTIERYSPGDIVSVPFGKKILNSMRMLVGGDKASPEDDFALRLNLGYPEEVSGMEGEAKDRQVLSRPEEPDVPAGAGSEIEIAFTIDPSGAVKSTEITSSSGSSAADALWLRYFRHWQFSPLSGRPHAEDQSGRIRFKLGSGRPSTPKGAGDLS